MKSHFFHCIIIAKFRDFKLHYDNTYGNCYTFNHDRDAERQSQRAGANYGKIFHLKKMKDLGLRVLLYADVTEYLPTSESVGFRITIHDKHIVPFPDAFGYSAPTGFQSSFGVRMVCFQCPCHFFPRNNLFAWFLLMGTVSKEEKMNHIMSIKDSNILSRQAYRFLEIKNP